MSQENPVSRKLLDFGNWPNGADSYSNPLLPREGYVRWMINCVNKGGLISTRPGLKTRYQQTLVPPDSLRVNPQGFDWFTPTNDGPWGVWAISGAVYVAKLQVDGSFAAPSLLANVAFNPNAQQVVFCRTLQSQSVINGLVVPVPARNVLIMQDGGSRACYWDGSTSGSLNPQKKVTLDSEGNTLFSAGFNETRIGLWMAWSGNRLFVADGPVVRASDIGDPLHFTEELTLTSVPTINLPTAVTGMIDRGTSGNVNSQCIIFCHNETYAVYSGVQIRIPDATNGYPGWQGTPNFLSKIFAGTGCVAGKSIVNHRGLIYWLSEGGIVMFDNINSVTSSQNMPAINTEEAYSNIMMSPNQTVACCGFFNSYVFWSLTTGATNGAIGVNAQTQVLDRQPMPTTPTQAFAWQGIWTGVNPVSWVTVEVFGQTRCYCMSYDTDGTVRFYEAFQGNRADNGRPIPWSVETPLHQVSGGVFDRANFLYSRAFLQNIYGNLGMVWRWKGTRGVWHEILTTQVTATPGSILTPTEQFSPIVDGTQLLSFLPQVRDILSRNLRGAEPDCQSTEVEASGVAPDASDRAFAMLYEFKGRGALAAYRVAADIITQDTEGEVLDAEAGFRILPGTGCPEKIDGVTPDYTLPDDNPNGIIAAFPPSQPQHFAVASGYTIDQAEPTLTELAAELPCITACGGGICSIAGNSVQQIFFAGKPGTYKATIRLAGVTCSRVLLNATQQNGWAQANTYLGPDAPFTVSNEYRLDISSPPQTYYLNYAPSNGPYQAWDYQNDVLIDAGATVTLSGGSPNTIQECSNAGITVPNVPEVTQPFDGSFFVMQPIAVVPS